MNQLINEKSRRGTILLCLLAALAVPVYLYGMRPLVIAAVAVATALVCDFVFNRFFHLPKYWEWDTTSVISALVISLLMPASIDYYVVVIAVVSGLLVGKYVFGGTGHCLFNPAALGVAVVALSFPESMFRFPLPGSALSLAPTIGEQPGIIFASSPASVLTVGGTPKINSYDLLMGNFPGEMGVTCVLVLIAALLFLSLRRMIAYKAVATALVTMAVFAAVFPRVSTGRTDSVIFELTSGMVLFGLIFMASEPGLTPRSGFGQVLYGFTLALLTMLFRKAGALNVEFVFVLLAVNAVSTQFDRLADGICDKIKHVFFIKKGGDQHAETVLPEA